MMKQRIKKDLEGAIKSLGLEPEKVQIEHPQNKEHGEYASSFALTNFNRVKEKLKVKTPLELARMIAERFPDKDYLGKVEAVEPGFVNFFLSESFLQNQIKEILDQKEEYGTDPRKREQRKETNIQIEFLSANPTGPLTAANCRGGFAGDVLANVMEKLGYSVHREYYINDKGKQIKRLARSIRARYKEIKGEKVRFPEDGYPGPYVKEIAREMIEKGRKDFKEFGLEWVLRDIRGTVKRMGIEYDRWFSEASLYEEGEVQKALLFLAKKNLTYKKKGAIWFTSSRFGDTKDRVLVKSDGDPTYFLSDLAYHINKFDKRGFDRVILFWGADHHGYVPRFMGMIQAIGYEGRAEVKICQFLSLKRGGEKVKMSKRAGDYVTADDLLDEIGKDAARFHFLMHGLDKTMTLDLKKAAQKSKENPVYYVQYAHARICSILRKTDQTFSAFDPSLLKKEAELDLMKHLLLFPELLLEIEKNRELHPLPNYALRLGDRFHKFYEQCRVLSKKKEVAKARLALLKATKIILAETLNLMGMEAPERM